MHSRSLFVQDLHANIFAFLKYQGQLSIEILLFISNLLWQTSMVRTGKHMVDFVTMTGRGKKTLGEKNFCISGMANRQS